MHTTWVYTLGSIVFFFVLLQVSVVLTSVQLFETSRTTSDTSAILLNASVLVLAIISAAAQIRCCWFLRAGLGGGMPDHRWQVLLLVPAALAWIVGLFLPDAGLYAALPLWMSANVLAPLLAIRPRLALIAAGAVITLAHPLLAAGSLGETLMAEENSAYRFVIGFGALLPLMVLTSMWWWRIVVELDKHRRAGAQLAVAQERLRFAADLHDIQGHHLQVIALKTELSERLLETDPDAARENLHEARLIARQALDETRSLVYGYRDVALTTELENAREVLTAAGADCELSLGALPDDPDLQRSLAMVVREATTNILRHSTATRAWIHLHPVADGIELVIGNNGADAGSNPHGNGLTGLRERVAAVGGRLEAGTSTEPGLFELRVWVPKLEVVA